MVPLILHYFVEELKLGIMKLSYPHTISIVRQCIYICVYSIVRCLWISDGMHTRVVNDTSVIVQNGQSIFGILNRVKRYSTIIQTL